MKYWSKMVMMMIGEQLDDDSNNLVCGAMFLTGSTGDTVQLWVDGGYAVRARGKEAVKPNLGQARQPMPSLLQMLLPPDLKLQWNYTSNAQNALTPAVSAPEQAIAQPKLAQQSGVCCGARE